MDIDEEYIHYQECITSLNTAWNIVCELECQSGNKILRHAAYRLALIEYCKPYKKSNGQVKKWHTLEKPILTDAEEILHKKIINIRDTVLAHSDINVKDARVYFGSSNGKLFPLVASNIESQWPTASEIRKLIEKTLDQLYCKQIEYEEKFREIH